MTDEEIKKRLSDFEDGWTERKQAHHTNDIRKALVAFANSVPDGEEAILFVGVADDGTIKGVGNAQSVQDTIADTASQCYPQINYNTRALQIDSESIVAVIVRASHDRPHFAGPAFVRVGCQSVRASERMFSELIASRTSKARPLLEAKRKGELVSVCQYPFGFSDHIMRGIPVDCTVLECTPLDVVFQSKTGEIITGSLEHMRLSRSGDGTQWRVEIEF